MEPRRVSLLPSVALLLAILLLPALVTCDNDEEDNLLQGLNSHRTAAKLSPFTENKKAACLADELADEIEDKSCVPTSASTAVPGTGSQYVNYAKLLKKCDLDPNSTRDGIILPVCVPKLVPTLVLTNYTHTPYAKYINDSRFTGVGVGSEKDWMVVVLTTNSTAGSFTSGAAATAGGCRWRNVGVGMVGWCVLWIVGCISFV